LDQEYRRRGPFCRSSGSRTSRLFLGSRLGCRRRFGR
jgi:hypothetical protein